MKHSYNFLKNNLLFFGLMIFAQTSFGQLSGKVFYDFNANGKQDIGENGAKSVTVKAFNQAGTQIGSTATTDSLGAFSITGSGPAKIVFENLPSGTYEGALGTESNSAIQFVNASSNAINLSLIRPAMYCQPNPKLVMPCYVNGDPIATIQGSTATAGISDVLIAFPFIDPSMADTSFKHLALAKDMGAVWGVAYRKQSDQVFTAAVLKRHSGYGKLGPSGIYMIDSTSTRYKPKEFLKLSAAPYNIDFGTDPHVDLSPERTFPSPDPNAFPLIGKMSMGGLDVSDDGKHMFTTNLLDRKLYSIFLDNPIKTPAAIDVKGFSLPATGCSNNDYRPWAVKYYNGKVYVGVVCSAETSQAKADLKAMVFEFDPSGAGSFNSTPKITFPLTYVKGKVTSAYTGDQDWLPWKDTFFSPSQGLGGREFVYPQAVLTDLEFDIDGSMILAFLDRTGMQMGLANHDFNGTCCYSGINGGDVLRAYPSANGWTLENNGRSGALVSGGGVSGVGGVGNGQGPGGGEFYFGEYFIFGGGYSATGTGLPHSELSLGAVAVHPAAGQMLLSAFDPETEVLAGGAIYLSNTTGDKLDGFQVYNGSTPGAFGKSAGIGDIEILCDIAPIAIGNRIWSDNNGNGLQDAGEAGLNNVVVELYQGNTLIAKDTTKVDGRYFFGMNKIAKGLKNNTTYTVRVPLTTAVNPSVASLFVAAANQGTNRAIDSDGTINATQDALVASVTIGNDPGQNDYSLDFGFLGCAEITQPSAALVLCSGSTSGSLSVKTTTQVIKFVRFNTRQTGTAMYTGGTALGTVVAAAGTATYTPAATDFPATAGSQTYYVYAILTPTPAAADCRPFQEIVVTSNAAPSAGPDQKICGSLSTATLPAATGTQTWAAQAGNPSAAVVATSGAVTGMTNAGKYTFTLTNNGCTDSVVIEKTKEQCAPMGWSIQVR